MHQSGLNHSDSVMVNRAQTIGFAMSRVDSLIKVPPRMYRHFAVVTVILTLCIAIFADGENREAISAEIKSQNQRAELNQADAVKFGSRKLGGVDASGRVKRSGGGGFGTETSELVFSSGTDTQGAGIGIISDSDGQYIGAETYDLGVINQPMTVGNQKGVVRTGVIMRKPNPKDKKPDKAQRAALEAAGFLRAGAPTTAE